MNFERSVFRRAAAAALSAAVMLAATPSSHAQQTPQQRAAAAQKDLDALIAAAKAEGELMFYSSPTENVAKRVADAFVKKYGVKANFIRLSGATLLQRYAAESEGNVFVADVITTAGNSVEYGNDGVKKGWLDPIATSGLPTLTSGEFPARFMMGPTAIIQISPWGVAYNTERVKAAELPKDWPDLLNARFKGQINITDPRSSDAQIDHWAFLLDRHGEPFFTALRAQNPRQFGTGVPNSNALAAGEGMLQVPAVPAQIQALKDKGAPVGWFAMDYSTGVEIQVALTTRTKAKHPNAGRLFANYLMSKEGNAVLNADPGSVSVYDTAGLPKNYQSPKPGSAARRDQFLKLLGFN
jgi:iron(III) transport system substrate-binding protein